MNNRRANEPQTSQRVISLSVVLCIVFSLINLSFACSTTLDSCCCSIISEVQNTDDNCCESTQISNCSLEESPCSCQSSSDYHVFTLPSQVITEFDIESFETHYIYADLPQLFDLHVEYLARGSPELHRNKSEVSPFISLYWPTIFFLC